MTETIENLFYFLVFLSDLLIILLITFFIKLTKNQLVFKLIALYCITDFITNFIAEFYPFKGIQILYSFFTFTEYIFFAIILSLYINNKTFKKAILLLSIFFTLFLAFYFINTRPRSIDSIPIGFETILIIIYTFYYLFEQMNDMSDKFVYNRYHFWLVIGIMLYLAGSFFIYVFANQVDRDTLNKYWFLTNMFYTLKNVLFAVGILTYVKQLKNPRPEKLYPYLN